MPPLKYAPSSITMPAVLISPTMEAPVRSETRLSDSTFPLMVPKTIISWALILAFTLLFGPTVKRLRKVQLAIQIAVQIQLFIAGYLADDLHGLAKHGWSWSRRRGLTLLMNVPVRQLVLAAQVEPGEPVDSESFVRRFVFPT